MKATREPDDVQKILAAIARLRAWLVAAVVLLSAMLLHSLVLSLDVRGQIEKVAYIKAQYEQQKVALYELDNRLTEAEIESEARLLALEKEHD
jgi:hypothetical protein